MSEDQVLNTTPTFTSEHTFSTADVTGTFGGLTQGDVGAGEMPVVDFSATPIVSQNGVELYPVNSDFGFLVDDFNGAVQKDFYDNPEYNEGYVGDLKGDLGEQAGLVVSNAETEVFSTPATLGTWLAGIGGSTVKASSEHYTVMQSVLSDQRYPGDPLAEYPLDDNLIVIGGQYDGQSVADVIGIVGDVNGDGVADIKDVLEPNESSITENIAASSDYSVTLKDDGKLLYRWGNAVKRPNDIRIEAELDLPDEWTEPVAEAPDLLPLFQITSAELVVNHTITNNPNDQIRPEDYENESAIGQLPTYEILPDGKWVTTHDYYAGDGTLYPAGTVLKDPALVTASQGSPLDLIGALSEDLQEGYTAAWFTTMDREPFEAELSPDGTEYISGPRWRLQPDKYGQDLPSVVIPADPSLPPPPTKNEVKYEVGEDTQTVINLLDWEYPISPLSISAGFQNMSGTVSENGLNLTDNFDVAFYIKGDKKAATLYNTQLVMTYEEIAIQDKGTFVAGAAGGDYLVGQGANTFIGDANTTEEGEDLFVLSYGVTNNFVDLEASTILDFQVGVDTLGLIDLSVTEANFDQLVSQTVDAAGLHISLGGYELATLTGVGVELGFTDFLLLNRSTDAQIDGTSDGDYLVGDDFDNNISGLAGDDTLLGLAGDDTLNGGAGSDELFGGAGDDVLEVFESAGAIPALVQPAASVAGEMDLLYGGEGSDTASFAGFASAVLVDLANTTVPEARTKDLSEATPGAFAWRDIADLDSIENIIGSAFDDWLVGDDGVNVLAGGLGSDTISGGLGDDILQLSQSVAGDVDVLDGGADVDTADFSDFASAVWVGLDYALGLEAWTKDMSEAGPSVGPWREIADLVSVENLTGSAFDDWLIGDGGSNVLIGGLGSDDLSGGAGEDVLRLENSEAGDLDAFDGGADVDTADFSDFGSAVWVDMEYFDHQVWTMDTTEAAPGAGPWRSIADMTAVENVEGTVHSDWIIGSASSNVLTGGLGNDNLEGRGGDDTMSGGIGDDTFVFTDGFGADVILDFEGRNDNEKIDLSGVTGITDAADLFEPVSSHISQVGNDVVIDDGAGSTITLVDVWIGEIGQTDFIF